MNDLSAKQQQILEYMKAEVREKGYPPSVREICEAVGLKSTSTVHGHLARLEKKGYIQNGAVTSLALSEIEPLKVDNAVILAAGGSDISAKSVYSMPKGL